MTAAEANVDSSAAGYKAARGRGLAEMSLRWSLVVLSTIILSAASDDGVLVTEDRDDSAGEDALRSYLVGLMSPSRGRPRSLEEDQSGHRRDSYIPPRAVAARRTVERESSDTEDETTTAPYTSTTASYSSTARTTTIPDDLEEADESVGTARNSTSGSARCGFRGWGFRGPFGFGGFPGAFPGGFGFGSPFMMG